MEEVSLGELTSYFMSKLLLIIVITLIFILGGIMYNRLLQVPKYKSETTLVLTHIAETSEAISQTDILLNKNLISTYREIIVSRTVLNQVIEKLKLTYDHFELSEMVEVTSKKDTEVIKIAVSSTIPEESVEIANLLAETFSEKVLDIYSIKNISIIDKAEIALEPYNVDLIKQIIMSTMIGLFSALSLVVIMFGMDNTIKNESEIERHLKLAVLGVVPTLKEDEEEENDK